jgi:short-subunit dehydrogenase
MAGLQVNLNIPGIGAFAMTKHGVIALSEALTMELQGSDIGISVLCPAQVDTTLYDSGRRRPERFGGSYQLADLNEARARSATGLSADAVGEHVVHAIRTNTYFIFTHPEASARVEERHVRMMAGFGAAAYYVGTRS